MGAYGLRVPASHVGYVPEAQGGLPQGCRVLYVLGTRTSLGRWVRTGNCGTPGKNDYKKVRDKLLEEFPALTKKSLKRVFSDKEETYVLKCSNGTVLYAAGDKPPSFFDDGFGNLYPTLTPTPTPPLTLTLTLTR